jgi:hypothetical protein
MGSADQRIVGLTESPCWSLCCCGCDCYVVVGCCIGKGEGKWGWFAQCSSSVFIYRFICNLLAGVGEVGSRKWLEKQYWTQNVFIKQSLEDNTVQAQIQMTVIRMTLTSTGCWTTLRSEFKFRSGQIFLFCTSFRQSVGFIQHPSQCASGCLSAEVKRPESENGHPSPTRAEVKKRMIYTS